MRVLREALGVLVKTMRMANAAVRVLLEAVRVILKLQECELNPLKGRKRLESARMIVKVLKVFLEAVRLIAENVRVTVEAMRLLAESL